MGPNPQFPSNLVTFTEEIFNGKLNFLCSAIFLLTQSMVKYTSINGTSILVHYECCFQTLFEHQLW